jgi:hypothetical protein
MFRNCAMTNEKQSGQVEAMTGPDLKSIRLALGFAPRDMCAVLSLPRRTYQDYEAGQRGIPAAVAERVRQVEERNRRFWEELPGRVGEAVSRDWPGGIVSDVCRE